MVDLNLKSFLSLHFLRDDLEEKELDDVKDDDDELKDDFFVLWLSAFATKKRGVTGEYVKEVLLLMLFSVDVEEEEQMLFDFSKRVVVEDEDNDDELGLFFVLFLKFKNLGATKLLLMFDGDVVVVVAAAEVVTVVAVESKKDDVSAVWLLTVLFEKKRNVVCDCGFCFSNDEDDKDRGDNNVAGINLNAYRLLLS